MVTPVLVIALSTSEVSYVSKQHWVEFSNLTLRLMRRGKSQRTTVERRLSTIQKYVVHAHHKMRLHRRIQAFKKYNVSLDIDY